jgi:hypothetical protein
MSALQKGGSDIISNLVKENSLLPTGHRSSPFHRPQEEESDELFSIEAALLQMGYRPGIHAEAALEVGRYLQEVARL